MSVFTMRGVTKSFASRLAPTGVTHSKCGSEPARESILAGNTPLKD